MNFDLSRVRVSSVPGSSPATGMAVTPGSTISSRGVSPTPASSNPFGVAPPMTSISPQPSSLGLSGLRTSPVPPNPMLGMVQPGMGMVPMSMGMGAPGMGLGMMQPSPMSMPYSGLSPMAPPGSGLMGPGVAPPPQLILGGPTGPGGVMGAGGSVGGGGTTGTSTNPFLLWGSVTTTWLTFQPPLSYLLPPSVTPPSPMQFVSKKKNVYISIFKENKQTKKTKSKKCFIFSFFESIISFQNNYFVYLVLSFHGLFYGWEIEIYLFCFNSVLYRTSCICFCFSFLVLSVLSWNEGKSVIPRGFFSSVSILTLLHWERGRMRRQPLTNWTKKLLYLPLPLLSL